MNTYDRNLPSLAQFERDAKRLSKAEHISLGKAKQRVAVDKGFDDWHHLETTLKSREVIDMTPDLVDEEWPWPFQGHPDPLGGAYDLYFAGRLPEAWHRAHPSYSMQDWEHLPLWLLHNLIWDQMVATDEKAARKLLKSKNEMDNPYMPVDMLLEEKQWESPYAHVAMRFRDLVKMGSSDRRGGPAEPEEIIRAAHHVFAGIDHLLPSVDQPALQRHLLDLYCETAAFVLPYGESMRLYDPRRIWFGALTVASSLDYKPMMARLLEGMPPAEEHLARELARSPVGQEFADQAPLYGTSYFSKDDIAEDTLLSPEAFALFESDVIRFENGHIRVHGSER